MFHLSFTYLRNSQAVSKVGTAVTSAKDKMVRSTTFDFISSRAGGPSNGDSNCAPEANGNGHKEESTEAPANHTASP